MLLVGGVVLQRQRDGLVVDEDVMVDHAQLDAAALAHDKGEGLLLGLPGIVGNGGLHLIVIA